MEIPEVIKIKKDEYTKPKRGPLTTLEKRRKNKAAPGKARGKKTFYSDKEKMEAACAFAVTGNSRRAAEITRISEATIRTWKQTEWWNEIQARIVKEQDEELGTKLTALIDKAVDNVNDRLDSGDYVYNPKLDKLIRKPVNAKDLAIVGAVLVDKRQLLRGQPTARIEKVSQEETLKRLAADFKKFALATEITQVPSQEVIQDATQIREVQESN